MSPVIAINNLVKTYAGGFEALKGINLDIGKGEIFALLGPNGAGKTTLINTICGIVQPTSGTVRVGGLDHIRDYRAVRRQIGLVPQELTGDAFETVWNTVSFSRGLFGNAPDSRHIEWVLRSMMLWDKRNNKLMTLSGGMKRRVLIAKALSHEPSILFLDEPTAGVDVDLRKGMWEVVRSLKNQGVTIILTTHYIEEAEAMADRVGVINQGQIVLVEDKLALMKQLGQKHLLLALPERLDAIPEALNDLDLTLSEDGLALTYTYDTASHRTGITALLGRLADCGIRFTDLDTKQSSLEEIFVGLVKDPT